MSDELYNTLYARAMELFPSFDESTLQPRLTQGDMCSYKPLTSIKDFFQTY